MNQKGFSLIGLIITVCLLSLLVFVVGSLVKWDVNKMQKEAKTELADDLSSLHDEIIEAGQAFTDLGSQFEDLIKSNPEDSTTVNAVTEIMCPLCEGDKLLRRKIGNLKKRDWMNVGSVNFQPLIISGNFKGASGDEIIFINQHGEIFILWIK